MSANHHRLLRFLLPARAFAAIEAGSRQWLIECPCGYKRDLWEAGGIRCKAAGEPRRWVRCPRCGQRGWHRTRRKTEAERQKL